MVNNQRDAQILFYVFISIYNSPDDEHTVLIIRRVINSNKHIEKNLCITLVIYQESLHDARSRKRKKLLSSVCVQLTPATDRQPPQPAYCLQPRPPPRCTATTAHLCHQVPATSHITHCSTAVVPAGILSECEKPAAVTCNYERLAERNSQTHGVKTERRAVWAGFH